MVFIYYNIAGCVDKKLMGWEDEKKNANNYTEN